MITYNIVANWADAKPPRCRSDGFRGRIRPFAHRIYLHCIQLVGKTQVSLEVLATLIVLADRALYLAAFYSSAADNYVRSLPY